MAISLYKELYKLLPPSYRERDDRDQELFLKRFLEGVDVGAGGDMVQIIESLERYIDPLTTPEKMLPWLSSWFNFDIIYFSKLFKWSMQKQRQIIKAIGEKQRWLGTKEGLSWFIENFIETARVEYVFEPWTKLVEVSGFGGVSKEGHIRNKDYWRDCVIHVYTTNAGFQIMELIRWLIDPRISIHLTHVQAEYEAFADNVDFFMGSDKESHAYLRLCRCLSVSDNGAISDHGKISCETTLCWPGNPRVTVGEFSSWHPLLNSMWRFDEIGVLEHHYTDKVITSENKAVSMEPTIGGSHFKTFRTPTFGEQWDYFGDIENITAS